jgi:hypothetical protein
LFWSHWRRGCCPGTTLPGVRAKLRDNYYNNTYCNTFIASNGCFMKHNKGLLERSSLCVLLRMGLWKIYDVFGDFLFYFTFI